MKDQLLNENVQRRLYFKYRRACTALTMIEKEFDCKIRYNGNKVEIIRNKK